MNSSAVVDAALFMVILAEDLEQSRLHGAEWRRVAAGLRQHAAALMREWKGGSPHGEPEPGAGQALAALAH